MGSQAIDNFILAIPQAYDKPGKKEYKKKMNKYTENKDIK